MDEPRRNYREHRDLGLVEIRLHSVSQLFNSLDPAPFHEKDLDREAEAYIVESVREFPLPLPLKLILHVPQAERAGAEAAQIEDAIHNYFAYRLWAERAVLRRELSHGRLALAIGLVFLFSCMGLRELLLSVSGGSTLARIVAEGLVIMGWVAMWRPIQVFLYDWWPIRRTCDIYAKLASLPVEIRASEATNR